MTPPDRLSWLRGAIIPVLLALTIGLWLFSSGPSGKPIHGPCLVHGDCHATERCLVVPASDGFATSGTCVDPCEDDLQCPAQQACTQLVEVERHWEPPGAAKAQRQPVGACQPRIVR